MKPKTEIVLRRKHFIYPQGKGGWAKEEGRWVHYCADCGKGPERVARAARCSACAKAFSQSNMSAKIENIAVRQSVRTKIVHLNRELDNAKRAEHVFRTMQAEYKKRNELLSLNKWKFIPMDKPLWNFGPTKAELLADCGGLNPLEELISKEEQFA